MKILIFSWRGPGHPHAGGAELVTHEHAKAWVKKGHQVVLFTSLYEEGSKNEVIDGVEIIRRGNAILSVQLEALKWYLSVNKTKFDLVIDQFHGLPFFTPLYVKARKIAFIHEVTKEVWQYNVLHEPWHTVVSFVGKIGEPWLFRLLYSGIPFLTVSNSTKQELTEFGISKEQITVINNGVKTIKTRVVSRKPIVTFFGAIAADKGIEDAIKVFSLLKDQKLSFWVIGRYDTEYIKYIKNIARKNHIESRIKFWGFVSDRKKFELLSQSYVVINPSIREGWGLTVIEAASVGTPTIAYPVVGLKDAIINGKTGILVDNKTPESLAMAVKEIFADKSRYKKLSQNAKKWSAKFDWPKSTRQSVRLIEKIIT